MKTVLKVRHNNASHPLLGGSEVTAACEGGVARCVSSPRGEWTFELDEGVTRVDLTLRGRYTKRRRRRESQRHAGHDGVAEEAAPQGDEEWSLEYDFRSSYRVAGGAVAHDAERSAQLGGKSSLDARVTMRGVAAERGGRRGGGVITLDVDLSFIDVTEALPTGSRDVVLDDVFGGCHARIYQYTGIEGAARCTAVAVLIPTALREGARPTEVESLTFFPPGNDLRYTLARDVLLNSFTRYTRHLGANELNGFWFLNGVELTNHRFDDYPPCRFGAQLEASRRRVLFVMPLPNGYAFEPFHSSAWTHTEGRRPSPLLDSLLRAVHSDGRFAGGSHTPRVHRGRVGVAGFSFGTESAIQCFRENAANVREFALFDPNFFLPGDAAQTKTLAWLAGNPDRRLHLFAGAHHHKLLAFRALARAHAVPGAQVLMRPLAPDFFFNSADYKAAHARATDPQITHEGDEREGAFSAEKKLYLHQSSELRTPRFVVRLPNGQLSDTHALPGFSLQEATTYLTHWPFRESRASFLRRYFEALRHVGDRGLRTPLGLRHQWPVFGGESDGPTHDGTFRGYLQILLDESGFAR